MKQAVQFAGRLQFSAMRFAMGALSLLPVLLITRERARVGRSEWPSVLFLGFLLVDNFGCTTTALVVGGAGKTGVIVYTMPFWVLLLARLFVGERLERWQVWTVLLALAGMVALMDPWHRSRYGTSDGLALASGLFWAGSVVAVKITQRNHKISMLTLTFWQTALGSVGFAAALPFLPGQSIDWSLELLWCVFYSGVLATALAWFTFYYAIRELPAGVAGFGTLMSPIVGVLAAWWQLGERPTTLDAAGMLLIGCGLAMLTVVPLLQRAGLDHVRQRKTSATG
jgi:drug/metabolite transporter (DMT)-like permease